MSETAIGFDVKADLIERLKSTTASYINDLKHVPEDKLGVSPMGVARSPIEFTAEVIGFNGLVVASLRGGSAEMPDQAARDAFTASIDSFAAAEAGLNRSCESLAAAIEATSLDGLMEDTMAPWGQALTKLKLSGFAVTHMVYHDGQLNYIQSLYGDAENHWH